MKKVIQTNHVTEALLLLAEIKNKGLAEFTAWSGSYSCVNNMDIEIHVPTWIKSKSADLKFKISFDLVGENKSVIEKLKYYRDNGFDNDPVIKSKRDADIATKKALLKKLQLELNS